MLKIGTYNLSGLLTGETADAPVPMPVSLASATSKVWTSAPMLLVADHEDDATYNYPALADNLSNDTTRLGSPGARLLASLPGHGIGANVAVAKPQGKVRMNIRLLYDPADPTATIVNLSYEIADILGDFFVAKQIYAQIGVQLEIGSLLWQPASPVVRGLLADSILTYNLSYEDQSGTEAQAMMDSLPSTASVNVIPVYYIRASIRSRNYSTDLKSLHGFTILEGRPSRGSVVICARASYNQTKTDQEKGNLCHTGGMGHVGTRARVGRRLRVQENKRRWRISQSIRAS